MCTLCPAAPRRSKQRFDEIEGKLTPFLRACGYNPKKDLAFIPISGLMGTNMKERVAANVCDWYSVSDASWGPVGRCGGGLAARLSWLSAGERGR
jgi:translation elongation factor EF-1alpha